MRFRVSLFYYIYISELTIKKMTINEIISSIELQIINGFKGSNNNHSYRLEEIKDNFILTVNAIQKKLVDSGVIPISDLTRSINCIELECKDIGECCEVNTGETVLHFKIPKLANLYGNKAVLYVGLANTYFPFKPIFGNHHIYNKYSVTKNEPYVWFKDLENGWLFNPPTNKIKYITLRGVFDNPYDLNRYNCCEPLDEDTSNYPANPEIIKAAMDEIVTKYLKAYRTVNIPYIANNGQSII
jgi:hypothetical protein